MPRPRSSRCTVGLVAVAAKGAYRVRKDNLIDPDTDSFYYETIGNHGYEITDTIAPVKFQGTGTSSLGALCLQPNNENDKTSPIIIAFRGTKLKDDVRSDLRLGILGVVEPTYRNDAYAFYEKVRKEHPDREIILTGHSLGGHLAQYVAAKAYNTDPNLLAEPKLQVRTFNTAPVNTTHSGIFTNSKRVLANFVNYRLSPDVVSDLPLQQYYGNTFVFPSVHGRLKSHKMDTVLATLPQEIMQQKVGTSPEFSKKHNTLVELINGAMSSYQCRIDGQYFSRFRAGAKNLEAMRRTIYPFVIDLLEKGNFDAAIAQLKELKKEVKGEISPRIIDCLIQGATGVKNEHKKLETLQEKEESVKNKQASSKFLLQKAELSALRKAGANPQRPNNELEEPELPKLENH